MTAIELLKNSIRDTKSYGSIVFWGNPNFLIVSKYEFDLAIAELEKTEAETKRLKSNLENYALLEECSPPDWPRKDFVKHLFDLWDVELPDLEASKKCGECEDYYCCKSDSKLRAKYLPKNKKACKDFTPSREHLLAELEKQPDLEKENKRLKELVEKMKNCCTIGELRAIDEEAGQALSKGDRK